MAQPYVAWLRRYFRIPLSALPLAQVLISCLISHNLVNYCLMPLSQEESREANTGLLRQHDNESAEAD